MTTLLCLAGLLALRFALATFARGADRFAWHRRFRRSGGDAYMDRWQLLRSYWVDVYLNCIRLPDEDPFPHNHPWRRSYSLKLWRSYVEQVFSGFRLGFMHYRVPRRWSRVPSFHRVDALPNGPCWTLFIGIGRRKGDGDSWGFFDLNTHRIIPHRERAAQRAAKETAS